MLSFPTVAASLALIASVSALPTTTSNTAKLEARTHVECSPGFCYSKCGTFDGCFNYDPCAHGQTFPPSPPSPPPPPACRTAGRVIAPQLLDLQVRSPDAPATNTSGNLMAIFRDDSTGHRFQDQVALFSGIPKDAKTCTLGWRQNGSPTRNFVRYDNGGLVSARFVPSLPSSVTLNAVKPSPPPAPPKSASTSPTGILLRKLGII